MTVRTMQAPARITSAPARALMLRIGGDVADPKRALCEYAAAPAGLAFDHIDWLMLRRGGLPITGDELRNRLEPLGVRTFAALIYAFGFDSIQTRGVKAPPSTRSRRVEGRMRVAFRSSRAVSAGVSEPPRTPCAMRFC